MIIYRIELTEDERSILLFALGSLAGTKLRNGLPIEDQHLVMKLARLTPLSESSAPPVPSAVGGTMEAAGASPHTAAARPVKNYWAKGFPSSIPAEPLEITPQKIYRKDIPKGKRLIVEWETKKDFCQASCWDESLFDLIIRALNLQVCIYVIRKDKFTNIVGVRV